MNPQFDKTHHFNLPPPKIEVLANSPVGAELAQPPIEMMVNNTPENRLQASQPAPLTISTGFTPGVQPLPPSNDVSTTTPVITPVMADDADLIEKEWVTKAKEIVDKTLDDPYRQSKDLTVFRADYMRKRYNKLIKITE